MIRIVLGNLRDGARADHLRLLGTACVAAVGTVLLLCVLAYASAGREDTLLRPLFAGMLVLAVTVQLTAVGSRLTAAARAARTELLVGPNAEPQQVRELAATEAALAGTLGAIAGVQAHLIARAVFVHGAPGSGVVRDVLAVGTEVPLIGLVFVIGVVPAATAVASTVALPEGLGAAGASTSAVAGSGAVAGGAGGVGGASGGVGVGAGGVGAAGTGSGGGARGAGSLPAGAGVAGIAAGVGAAGPAMVGIGLVAEALPYAVAPAVRLPAGLGMVHPLAAGGYLLIVVGAALSVPWLVRRAASAVASRTRLPALLCAARRVQADGPALALPLGLVAATTTVLVTARSLRETGPGGAAGDLPLLALVTAGTVCAVAGLLAVLVENVHARREIARHLHFVGAGPGVERVTRALAVVLPVALAWVGAAALGVVATWPLEIGGSRPTLPVSERAVSAGVTFAMVLAVALVVTVALVGRKAAGDSVHGWGRAAAATGR